jgi:hypothetical protein
MFVQIIVADDADERVGPLLDRWEEELRPGAPGFLGETGGLTGVGTLFGSVRFATAEDARRNAARPEQQAWWQEVEGLLPHGARFHDCDDVALVLGGGDDSAGFVQVMESTPPGPVDLDALARSIETYVTAHRPDVVGALLASDGQRLFQIVYFTSEEEARKAEAAPPDDDPDVRDVESSIGDVRYHDLHRPVLLGPAEG